MPSRTLPGLGLRGFWNDGEHGWGTNHSEDLRVLSALVQGRCIDIVNALPGSPVNGDIYVCSATEPTNPNKVAIRDNGAWVYLVPFEGLSLYNLTTNGRVEFDGAVWKAQAKPSYAVGGFFNISPGANEPVLQHVFAEPVDFPDDFTGSVGHVGTNPSATYTMNVQKNEATIGTLSVSTGGAITYATTGGAISFAAGDRLEVIGAATPDALIANFKFTFLGAR